MKHTQGEWSVTDTDEKGDIIVNIPGHDIYIANIEGSCGECHANAHLIAAAPDLLKAAQAAFDVMSADGYAGIVVHSLRKAIAKANER